MTRSLLRPTLLHLLLAAGALSMVLPFLWMLSTSLKPESQIFRFPPVWIPDSWRWANYQDAMSAAPFGRYFLNTLIYAGAVTLSNLLFCSMAAYAFARLQFRGRNVLFILVLGTMMIPGQVTMVPVFIMLKHWPLVGGNDLLGSGGHGGTAGRRRGLRHLPPPPVLHDAPPRARRRRPHRRLLGGRHLLAYHSPAVEAGPRYARHLHLHRGLE
jgi:ABC-type sugar transport system permease subunit